MSGCSCGHAHGTLTVHQERRRDPTMTKTLRRKFEAEFYRRLRRIKGLIRREIVERDGFGLRNRSLQTNRGRFEFTRSDEKVGAFMQWLNQMQRDELFTVRAGTPIAAAARQEWTHLYIESAYRSGLNQAAARMRAEGASVADEWVLEAFNRPIHADRVGLLYTRAYEELQGVTAAMDQQISRVLAQGIADGIGARDLARQLNDRVDKIGITRARMIARTEVISSHAEASLNAYEEAGAEGVEIEAEWSTADDGLVCELCEAAAENGPYTLDEAHGMIPLHPNCRCAFIPKVKNPSEVVLR